AIVEHPKRIFANDHVDRFARRGLAVEEQLDLVAAVLVVAGRWPDDLVRLQLAAVSVRGILQFDRFGEPLDRRRLAPRLPTVERGLEGRWGHLVGRDVVFDVGSAAAVRRQRKREEDRPAPGFAWYGDHREAPVLPGR